MSISGLVFVPGRVFTHEPPMSSTFLLNLGAMPRVELLETETPAIWTVDGVSEEGVVREVDLSEAPVGDCKTVSKR